MKIVIPGGSGHLGTILRRAFEQDGHDVIVVSRRGPATLDAIDGADVVINLAGRSVNCRYNAANRRAIMDSRVDPPVSSAKPLRRRCRRRASGCKPPPPRSTPSGGRNEVRARSKHRLFVLQGGRPNWRQRFANPSKDETVSTIGERSRSAVSCSTTPTRLHSPNVP